MAEASLRYVIVHGEARFSRTEYICGRNSRSEYRNGPFLVGGDPKPPETMQLEFGPEGYASTFPTTNTDRVLHASNNGSRFPRKTSLIRRAVAPVRGSRAPTPSLPYTRANEVRSERAPGRYAAR